MESKLEEKILSLKLNKRRCDAVSFYIPYNKCFTVIIKLHNTFTDSLVLLFWFK